MTTNLLAGVAVSLAMLGAPRNAGEATGQGVTSPWERLQGQWRGAGRFIGADATVELKVESVLGGRFYRLTRRVQMRTASGEAVHEGIGYYATASGGLTSGTWFDSEGHVYVLDAALRVDALDTRWGPAGSVIGRSVYSVGGDSLVVLDSARLGDGRFSEFGRLVARRQETGNRRQGGVRE